MGRVDEVDGRVALETGRLLRVSIRIQRSTFFIGPVPVDGDLHCRSGVMVKVGGLHSGVGVVR